MSMTIITIPIAIILGWITGKWIVDAEHRIGTKKAWIIGIGVLLTYIILLNVLVALIWEALGL